MLTEDQTQKLAVGDPELRAGERLRQYLLTELERQQSSGGSRLPTNKELAQRLNVSLGTVQGVLRQFAQDGRIRARRGSGTYLVPTAKPASQSLRIGICIPLEKFRSTDGWVSRLGGGMFQAALEANASLEGVSSAGFGTEKVIEELMDKKSQIDALILMPYVIQHRHHYLIDAYEKEGKPVVFIHPPSLTATANFSSTDYFGASYELGQIWRKAQRKRVLLLTNKGEISCLHQGVSSQLRYAGLVSGLGPDLEGPQIYRMRATTTPEMSESSGYEAIQKILKEGEPPDAIYFADDQLALGGRRALLEAGLRIPEDVALVGATGGDLSRSDCPDLTRVRHELEKVAAMAVSMAIQRITLKGISLPGCLLPTSFMGGGTTRADENTWLKIRTPGDPYVG